MTLMTLLNPFTPRESEFKIFKALSRAASYDPLSGSPGVKELKSPNDNFQMP